MVFPCKKERHLALFFPFLIFIKNYIKILKITQKIEILKILLKIT